MLPFCKICLTTNMHNTDMIVNEKSVYERLVPASFSYLNQPTLILKGLRKKLLSKEYVLLEFDRARNCITSQHILYFAIVSSVWHPHRGTICIRAYMKRIFF